MAVSPISWLIGVMMLNSSSDVNSLNAALEII